MKTIKINNRSARFFSVGILLFIAFMLPSCARKMSFQTSNVVPAAEGRVKVKKNKNKNYDIDLSLIRLVDPSRLDPPKKVYVVWMNTQHNGTKAVGQLNTSSSLLSKTMKSSLKTSVPFQPTSFFITAEDDADMHRPSGQVVLRTN
ncbi:MAG: hypothetical protein Q8891_14030 [Bacteroidota bacterium]|jgi:hypothetical protein|nr:hypothetical protein [Bacteroidota bacterium]